MGFLNILLNLTIFILVLNFENVFSVPYGVNTNVAASSSADLVIGFDNTANSGTTNLIHNTQSYAHENERKVVEVRRVSTNEVESRNNYGRQTETNSNSGSDKYQQNEVKTQNSVRPVSDNQQRSVQGTNINAVTGLDNDAIIFPDSVAKYAPRDSYGNPVTPYTTLPDEPVSIPTDVSQNGIGHKTDVNRDEGVSGNSNENLRPDTNTQNVRPQTSQNNPNFRPQTNIPSSQISQNSRPQINVPSSPSHPETLGFILPSYASGITKLETFSSGTVTARPSIPRPNTNLLPPLSSGNYNYPQLNAPSKETKKTTTSTDYNTPSTTTVTGQHNYASQTNNNAYTHTRINSDSYQPQNNENSRNTVITQRPNSHSYPSETIPTVLPKTPKYDEAIVFPSLQPPRVGSVSTYESGQTGFNQGSNAASSGSNYRNIQVNSQTDAPRTSSNYPQSVQNSAPKTASVSNYQGPQISQQIQPPQPPQSSHSSTNYRNQMQNDSPQITGSNYHGSNTQQTEAPKSSPNYNRPVQTASSHTERYSGGFGGAPGILSPFDSSTTITRQSTANVYTNPPTVPPHISQNTGSYSSTSPKESVGNIPSRTASTHQHQHQHHHDHSTASRYQGGFGGAPGVLTPYDNIKNN